MKLYDISLSVFPGMVVWPDNPNVTLRRTLDQAKGDLATVSELSLGVHTGTHLDAPLHFVPGSAGVDALPLEVLCGPALVCQALNANALTADGARWLVEHRVKVIGIVFWNCPFIRSKGSAFCPLPASQS